MKSGLCTVDVGLDMIRAFQRISWREQIRMLATLARPR